MNDLLFASHTQRRALYAVERDGGLFEVLGDVSTPTVGCGFSGGLASVRVLAPVLSSKIVAVGPNYRVHAAEQETWSPSFRPS